MRALPETMSGISRVEVLSGGDAFGTGTRWKETRVMFGKEASEVMEVTAVDPYRSYKVEAESNGMHYVSTFTFEALEPQKTRVEMTFAGRALKKQNFLVRLLGRFAAGMVRKTLEKDLEDLVK
ncbi:MAG TPA: SRPBCC family protein, partial [Myxococcaceae bacterium]|nr:SRPBCC family protein [Myxococcaceae bacterium]